MRRGRGHLKRIPGSVYCHQQDNESAAWGFLVLTQRALDDELDIHAHYLRCGPRHMAEQSALAVAALEGDLARMAKYVNTVIEKGE